MGAERRPRIDGSIMAAIVAAAATAVVLALVALVAFGWHAARGVAAGGLLATLNLFVLARAIGGALGEGPRGRRIGWAIVAGIKFVGLLVVAALLLQSGVAAPLALAVGYGALPVGLTVASLRGHSGDEPRATSPTPGRLRENLVSAAPTEADD